MNEITWEQLLSNFGYDDVTGALRHRNKTKKFSPGDDVGFVRPDGYLETRVNQQPVLVHRLVWLLLYGRMPNEIDHLNGIRTDNRIENLREVTRRENQQNRWSHRDGKLVGAFEIKERKLRKPWKSYIQINGKRKHLGYFATEKEAHDAYMDACKRLNDA